MDCFLNKSNKIFFLHLEEISLLVGHVLLILTAHLNNRELIKLYFASLDSLHYRWTDRKSMV